MQKQLNKWNSLDNYKKLNKAKDNGKFMFMLKILEKKSNERYQNFLNDLQQYYIIWKIIEK